VLHEFHMPDAGEGLTEAEVLSWRVAPGDRVSVNQVLLEVETAKAAVELPSPWAGTVVELLASPGDVVPVGAPIIRIDDGANVPDGGSAPVATQPAEPASGPPEGGEPGPEEASTDEVEQAGAQHESSGSTEAAGGTQAEGRTAVLVGYGVRSAQVPRRRARVTPHGVDHVEPGPPGVPTRPVRHGGLEQARAVEDRLADAGPGGVGTVRAKPPVRRLARDLDVDLSTVHPTGPSGTITHDDVLRAAEPAADAEVVPLSHVGRMMARAMTQSAFTAPHVTEWLDVDVTRMTDLMRSARARPDWADLPLTPLTFTALGLVRAAVAHPTVNSRLDASGENLLVARAVHLGIAVDSPRGLVVPHVRDAHLLDLRGMALALGSLVETARAGRSRPEELAGSTITLTNVGVLGVDGGTPILNPGEVAILALGRVLPRPWVVGDQVVVRHVVTLALSFDHRVVDGSLGARVLREVADFLADPAGALALG